MLTFRVFSKLMGEPSPGSFGGEQVVPSLLKDIAWAVNKACVVAPWGRKCLINALTAKWLAKRSGIQTTYFLGVGRDCSGKLIYHAWLKYGNFVVSGGNVDHSYKVLGLFR